MASIEFPIKVNLPDNWVDIVVEKLKKDENICMPVIRCKNCKWFGEAGCAIKIVDDSDKPTENDISNQQQDFHADGCQDSAYKFWDKHFMPP